jgi:signal transduction histidine kinase
VVEDVAVVEARHEAEVHVVEQEIAEIKQVVNETQAEVRKSEVKMEEVEERDKQLLQIVALLLELVRNQRGPQKNGTNPSNPQQLTTWPAPTSCHSSSGTSPPCSEPSPYSARATTSKPPTR